MSASSKLRNSNRNRNKKRDGMEHFESLGRESSGSTTSLPDLNVVVGGGGEGASAGAGADAAPTTGDQQIGKGSAEVGADTSPTNTDQATGQGEPQSEEERLQAEITEAMKAGDKSLLDSLYTQYRELTSARGEAYFAPKKVEKKGFVNIPARYRGQSANRVNCQLFEETERALKERLKGLKQEGLKKISAWHILEAIVSKGIADDKFFNAAIKDWK